MTGWCELPPEVSGVGPVAIQPAPNRAAAPLQRYRYVRWRWWVLFGLLDLMGTLVMTVWRTRCRLFRRSEVPSSDSPRRILIVQLDHLGDAILSLGLVEALRAAYPQAEIDILASRCNAPLWRACHHVSRVWQSRATRWDAQHAPRWIGAMVTGGRRLRRRNYDWGIDVRGEFPAVVLLTLAGVRRRIGWASGGGGFLLTDVAPYVPHRHEVLARQALLRTIGLDELAASAVPRWSVAAADRQSLRRRFPQLHSSQRLVVLHLHAGTAAKRWPLAHWQRVVALLRRLEPTVHLVLVGSAEARFAEVALTSNWPEDRVTDTVGRLEIPELAALLQQAAVLVTADSGPGHLAAAVGTPVVVLFSGTNHAEQWRPWGPGVAVLQHPVPCAPCHRSWCALSEHPCMHGMDPEIVVAQVQSTLAVRAVGSDPVRTATSKRRPGGLEHVRSHS